MSLEMLFEPTPVKGISYYWPESGYRLTGRGGAVDIPWGEIPIPLTDADRAFAGTEGWPGYDHIGRGIFQLLRADQDCAWAEEYAGILRDAYPHIVAEIGGEAIMLDSREVDIPYLDRKVALLRIMGLLEPDNPGLWLEIGRTMIEKGTRIDVAHMAVQSWYGAERYLKKAVELAPDDHLASYQLGEAHYMLGHYDSAISLWESVAHSFAPEEQRRLSLRIESIRLGEIPKVPPVDYLTALSVAIDLRHEDLRETVAIIEDILADHVFSAQFPTEALLALLGECYVELGYNNAADDIIKRC